MINLRRTALALLALSILAPANMYWSQGAMAQSPNPHAVSMYNLGLNAHKQGSPESAIIFFRRAADIDPNLADAQYNLGVLYMSQRRFKEAIPRFKEVLRVKPSDSEAHFQLGVTHMGLGDFNAAIQEFNTIAPNNSHFAEAQKKVAECKRKVAQGGSASKVQPGPVRNSGPAAQSPPATSNRPPQQPQSSGLRQPQTSSSYGTNQPAQTTPSRTVPDHAIAARPQQQPSAQPQIQSPAPAPTPSASRPTAVLGGSSVRVIATGFKAPSGLTFDKYGNLYVANFKNNTVDRISRDGSRTQFSKGGHLKGPIGLAADDSGNIYVANYNSGTIARITPAGISTVIATGFNQPYYLTLDRNGNLFVSQQSDNTIIRVTLPNASRSRPTASRAMPAGVTP